MEIERLSDLNLDDLRFIQENHLARLTIKEAPQEAETQLTEFLTQCPSLSHVRVGCEWKRSLAIVNLVLSTRENIIAQNGSLNLRTFEVMDEGLTPFDKLADRDYNNHIQCHISFPDNSNSFEMRTWIRLQTTMRNAHPTPVIDFVHRYGWSVVFFDGYLKDINILTTLNKMTHMRTPQLESLMVDCYNSVRGRVNHLDNIIQQSPNFKNLGLYVSTRTARPQQVLSLLGQYGTILSKLQIHRSDIFSRVASSFPTRNNFPALESFEINFSALESPELALRMDSASQWPFRGVTIPSHLTLWIVAMVSAPLQSPASSSASELLQDTITDGQNTHSVSDSARSWTPLKKVMLRGVKLQLDEWRRIIEALDVSALEYLDLGASNIAEEQLKIDPTTDNNAPKWLSKTVNARRNNFSFPIDSITLDVARLKKRAPMVRIIIDL